LKLRSKNHQLRNSRLKSHHMRPHQWNQVMLQNPRLRHHNLSRSSLSIRNLLRTTKTPLPRKRKPGMQGRRGNSLRLEATKLAISWWHLQRWLSAQLCCWPIVSGENKPHHAVSDKHRVFHNIMNFGGEVSSLRCDSHA